MSLNRLSRRQRAEMIAGVTGGKALPKEIADQIIDRTDGVPLFIEELTKSVVESGLVTKPGDHYSVAGPTAPLAIPDDAARFATSEARSTGSDTRGGADRSGARALVLPRVDQRRCSECRSNEWMMLWSNS